jgi:hypothetical protein
VTPLSKYNELVDRVSSCYMQGKHDQSHLAVQRALRLYRGISECSIGRYDAASLRVEQPWYAWSDCSNLNVEMKRAKCIFELVARVISLTTRGPAKMRARRPFLRRILACRAANRAIEQRYVRRLNVAQKDWVAPEKLIGPWPSAHVVVRSDAGSRWDCGTARSIRRLLKRTYGT